MVSVFRLSSRRVDFRYQRDAESFHGESIAQRFRDDENERRETKTASFGRRVSTATAGTARLVLLLEVELSTRDVPFRRDRIERLSIGRQVDVFDRSGEA